MRQVRVGGLWQEFADPLSGGRLFYQHASTAALRAVKPEGFDRAWFARVDKAALEPRGAVLRHTGGGWLQLRDGHEGGLYYVDITLQVCQSVSQLVIADRSPIPT